jgi:predicted adenine nucleotide alpha hydrolase (AANH) superfamily ATPase
MGLAEFVLRVARVGRGRCRACYDMRFEAAAREAAERGCDAFSTTLLLSPHQDLNAIAEVGAQVGERSGVEFQFVDLRSRYPESCRRARELDLYRQQYCGCVFSSLERAERRARRAIAKGLPSSNAAGTAV